MAIVGTQGEFRAEAPSTVGIELRKGPLDVELSAHLLTDRWTHVGCEQSEEFWYRAEGREAIAKHRVGDGRGIDSARGDNFLEDFERGLEQQDTPRYLWTGQVKRTDQGTCDYLQSSGVLLGQLRRHSRNKNQVPGQADLIITAPFPRRGSKYPFGALRRKLAGYRSSGDLVHKPEETHRLRSTEVAEQVAEGRVHPVLHVVEIAMDECTLARVTRGQHFGSICQPCELHIIEPAGIEFDSQRGGRSVDAVRPRETGPARASGHRERRRPDGDDLGRRRSDQDIETSIAVRKDISDTGEHADRFDQDPPAGELSQRRRSNIDVLPH